MTWCRCCQRENVAFYPGLGHICGPCALVSEALRKYWRAVLRRQLIGGAT